MRPLVVLCAILILSLSCSSNNGNTIEGDLYFKLIDLTSFYGASDSELSKIETWIKTVNKDSISDSEKKYYEFLKFMSDQQLLRKPLIRLRQDNGEIIMLFLEPEDYGKIKNYNYSDLVRDNQKIRIKAEVIELKHDSMRVYKILKLISADKIDGKTYWKK